MKHSYLIENDINSENILNLSPTTIILLITIALTLSSTLDKCCRVDEYKLFNVNHL